MLVGEVSRLHISEPLPAEEGVAIEAGMDRYAILVFHDQEVTDEQQMVPSRHFGALENARGGNVTTPEDTRLVEGTTTSSTSARTAAPSTRFAGPPVQSRSSI